MTWIIPAILTGVIRAFIFDINRHYKIDGNLLNFWRLIFSVALLAPICIFYVWPTNPLFYFAGIFSGLVIGFGDQYLWKLAAGNNSRVASMFDSVNALGSFVLWLAVIPASFFALIEDTYTFIGVLLCYLAMFYGMWVMKKSPYSWEAFRTLLAVCFFNIINAIIIKYSMEDVSVTVENTLIIMFIMYTVAAFVAAFISLFKTKALPEYKKEFFKPSFYIGIPSLIAGGCSVYALSAAPNPGYAIMLAALAPVWLVFIHKAIKAEDHTKPLPVLLILISSVMLVLLTN